MPRAEIDPRYLETPYYIAPNDKVAQEAFAVIREAMRDAGMVGIGRVVISRRERIVMLEPLKRGLLGTVLRYDYEVRGEDSYFDAIAEVKLPDEMKELAHLIIDRKAGNFDPTAFKDRYEDALVALVQSKQTGLPADSVVAPAASNVVDLMEALRRSIGGSPTTAKPKASKPGKSAPTTTAGEIPPKPAARSKEKPAAPAPAKSSSRGKKAG